MQQLFWPMNEYQYQPRATENRKWWKKRLRFRTAAILKINYHHNGTVKMSIDIPDVEREQLNYFIMTPFVSSKLFARCITNVTNVNVPLLKSILCSKIYSVQRTNVRLEMKKDFINNHFVCKICDEFIVFNFVILTQCSVIMPKSQCSTIFILITVVNRIRIQNR